MSHQEAEPTGNKIIDFASAKEKADKFAETGELSSFLSALDNIKSFEPAELAAIKETIIADKNLQAETGYDDTKFAESVNNWVNFMAHQFESFKLIPIVMEMALNPKEILEKIVKEPTKFAKAIMVLKRTAEMRIAISEGQHLENIPPEQQGFLTQVAEIALKAMKPIDALNILGAKALVKSLDALGYGNDPSTDIPIEFISPDRWSLEEFKIANAIAKEAAKGRVIDMIKTIEHNKEMGVLGRLGEKVAKKATEAVVKRAA